MENPTPFDLNAAIHRWQQDLAASLAVDVDNLEELTAHLRDSIQRLKATGLSEAESFLVASRRMGTMDQLSGEFSKVNGGLVWRVRAFWMLAGTLVYLGASQGSNLVSNASMALCSLFLANGSWLGCIGIATWISVVVLAVYLFHLIATGRFINVNASMAWLLKRRWTAAAVVFCGVTTLMAANGIAMVFLVRNVPSATLVHAFMFRNVLYATENLTLPIVVLVVLTKLGLRKGREGTQAVE